jgi:flagellar biosynthetic protein FliR
MLREFLAVNIFGFFLSFARIGTALILLPGFSAGWVSVRSRAAIALAVTFVSLPLIEATWPPMPATPAALIVLLAGEILVGALIGSVGLILIAALQACGSFIALFSSMANAMIRDPIAESQSALTAGFLTTAGVVMIFVTDAHHMMLEGVLASYTIFIPGQGAFDGDMADTIARTVSDSFALGLQMTAPFLVVALTYYVGLGLLNRLMPLLPIFFVGLPVQIMLQIAVFMITFSGIMMTFMNFFGERFRGLFISV